MREYLPTASPLAREILRRWDSIQADRPTITVHQVLRVMGNVDFMLRPADAHRATACVGMSMHWLARQGLLRMHGRSTKRNRAHFSGVE